MNFDLVRFFWQKTFYKTRKGKIKFKWRPFRLLIITILLEVKYLVLTGKTIDDKMSKQIPLNRNNYLINNKLYLKNSIEISCYEYFEHDSNWSSTIEKVILTGCIDICFFGLNHLVFNKERDFIYWTDVDSFIFENCLEVSDIRDEKIDRVLSN